MCVVKPLEEGPKGSVRDTKIGGQRLDERRTLLRFDIDVTYYIVVVHGHYGIFRDRFRYKRDLLEMDDPQSLSKLLQGT